MDLNKNEWEKNGEVFILLCFGRKVLITDLIWLPDNTVSLSAKCHPHYDLFKAGLRVIISALVAECSGSIHTTSLVFCSTADLPVCLVTKKPGCSSVFIIAPGLNVSWLSSSPKWCKFMFLREGVIAEGVDFSCNLGCIFCMKALLAFKDVNFAVISLKSWILKEQKYCCLTNICFGETPLRN